MDLLETQRPVIYMPKWHKTNMMLDTGALFPVWTEEEELLKAYGGKLIKKNIPISGLGGKTVGSLYVLPLFELGKLTFIDLHLIAHRLELACDMLLPATMFQNLLYEVDNRNHKLNVTIPDDESRIRNLVIKEDNGKVHVLCSSVWE